MTVSSDADDAVDQAEQYRKVVLLYENLQGQINLLLKANDGSSHEMSSPDRKQYRELAQQRDEAMNEMRWLESQWLEEED